MEGGERVPAWKKFRPFFKVRFFRITNQSLNLLGRYQKVQKFDFVGGSSKRLKIHASMVVFDVLHMLCEKMGEEDRVEEYGLFIRTKTNTHGALLRSEDYVLDICSILEERNIPFNLFFKKLLWFGPTKFQNNMYNQLIFDQVWNDFVAGNYAIENRSGLFAQQDVPTLICWAFIAKFSEPSLDGLLSRLDAYVPSNLRDIMSEDSWRDKLSGVFNNLDRDPSVARKEFLTILSNGHDLYGSRFFHLPQVFDNRVGSPAILAINRSGIFFLDGVSKQIKLKYNFNEVVSMRRLGSQSKGKHFIDLKLGNLMVQRVTRCETWQGTEIVGIISWFIRTNAEHQSK